MKTIIEEPKPTIKLCHLGIEEKPRFFGISDLEWINKVLQVEENGRYLLASDTASFYELSLDANVRLKPKNGPEYVLFRGTYLQILHVVWVNPRGLAFYLKDGIARYEYLCSNEVMVDGKFPFILQVVDPD